MEGRDLQSAKVYYGVVEQLENPWGRSHLHQVQEEASTPLVSSSLLRPLKSPVSETPTGACYKCISGPHTKPAESEFPWCVGQESA